MEERIQKYFKEALFLQNRGFTKEARLYYDQIKNHLELIDADGLKLLSKFYDSQQEYDVVLKVTRLGIEKSGDIRELAPMFILAWEKVGLNAEELEWLLKQPGIDHLTFERLIIARHLFAFGKKDKAYMISLEVVEQMEMHFRENPSEYKNYIHAILNLVELEFNFKNYSQARFQLRKLIYLEKERLALIQEIAYWAIILDEIAHFVTRPDWKELERGLMGDVARITKFYRQLSQRSLTKQVVKELHNEPFQELVLETKRNSYLRLIMKMQGKKDWFVGIEKDREKVPDDLLTTLLYADYLKSTCPEELKAFWKTEFPKHADRVEAVKAYWNNSKKVEAYKPNLEGCAVTFLGGGEKIGGTSILISVRGHHLLLDAGMHLHEEEYHPDYSPLFKKGISFEEIDALLITHAHMDHTGAVPYVHKQRRDLPIYATEATVRLMRLLLSDSVRLNKDQTDMFDEVDLQSALLSIKHVDFHQSFVIPSHDGSEWKITYFPSGHIIGAASIYIEHDGISILFTGDYSIDDQRTVKGLVLPDDLRVDVLITESTYGFLPLNGSIDRARQEKVLVESIQRTMEKGGSILIPAFAVGRAQEIILILKEAFKEAKYLPFNLFLDGKVVDVCREYQRFSEQHRYINPKYYQFKEEEYYFFGGGVQSARDIYSDHRYSDFTFEGFFKDFISNGNNCIVASSGMLTEHSASARYAEHLIEEEQNTISFTGYMDEESPAHYLLRNAKLGLNEVVKVNGVEKQVNARIESFRLSAHASREQIFQLIADLQPKQVFIMHGEHNKRYHPAYTIRGGEVIYPTLIDLLAHVKEEIEITPAYNGKSYFFDKKE